MERESRSSRSSYLTKARYCCVEDLSNNTRNLLYWLVSRLDPSEEYESVSIISDRCPSVHLHWNSKSSARKHWWNRRRYRCAWFYVVAAHERDSHNQKASKETFVNPSRMTPFTIYLIQRMRQAFLYFISFRWKLDGFVDLQVKKPSMSFSHHSNHSPSSFDLRYCLDLIGEVNS